MTFSTLCVLALAASASALRPSTVAPRRTLRQTRSRLYMSQDLKPWGYSELLKNLNDARVERVLVRPDASQLTAIDSDGDRHPVNLLYQDRETVASLVQKDVEVFVQPNQAGALDVIGPYIFPLFLFFGLPLLVSFLFRRSSGGMPGPMGGGGGGGGPLGGMMGNRNTYKVEERPDTRFTDVAGADEAKRELVEVVDFLKDPTKYTRLGAQLPRGCLLEGPPGTGKTLLARAVAGEADAKFLSISGSEFVEMFVGLGAARVRNLFQEARKNAPCVVFIDEIDAVGGRRGSGVSNGNDEREQTLNQILTEMDGFKSSDGVLVVAATNRKDTLDPALLRPGRFDRQVRVEVPDKEGRKKILRVHARGRPLAEDISLDSWATRAVGFSGAQLKNLMNEGSMLAARRNATAITDVDLRGAFEKIVVGLRKDEDRRDDLTKRVVAYHETGHTLTGVHSSHPNVSYVTIRPTTNGAGGFTLFEPMGDGAELPTLSSLKDRMMVMLGGRAAELIIFGEEGTTPGASQDLSQAQDLAKSIVQRWGLSDVGPVGGNDGPQSPAMADKVEEECLKLVEEAQEAAVALLEARRDELDNIAEALLKDETITGEEVMNICGIPVEPSEGSFLPPSMDKDAKDKQEDVAAKEPSSA